MNQRILHRRSSFFRTSNLHKRSGTACSGSTKHFICILVSFGTAKQHIYCQGSFPHQQILLMGDMVLLAKNERGITVSFSWYYKILHDRSGYLDQQNIIYRVYKVRFAGSARTLPVPIPV
jgi:hypothetical protein